MTIEAKFDIGQKVYTIEEFYGKDALNKYKEVVEWEINGISYAKTKDSHRINYSLIKNGLSTVVSEYQLFATKEEAEEGLDEIYEDKYYDLQKTHEQLKEQLATTRKALDLACKFMSDYCIPCPPLNDCPAVVCHKDKKDCYYGYFIKQASF